MFCPQCGTQVGDHYKFCSRCGVDLGLAAAAQPQAASPIRHRDMAMHVNILGWLFIGSAILTGILGMIMIFAGQLIRYLPIEWPADVPFDAAHLATSLAALIGFSTIVVAAGIAAAGVGLLQYRSWGRTVALVMSVLFLFKFPIGTAIGIYALWVLLSEQGREFYKTKAAVAEGHA